MTALRIGGLHRQRRLGLDAVERLAHEVREHAAGPGLDEVRRAELVQRAAARRSSGPVRSSASTSRSCTSSPNGCAVTQESTGTRGARNSICSTSSLNGATAGSISRRVEGAAHRQALGAHLALAQQLLARGRAHRGAGQDQLVGGVVVGDRQTGVRGDLLHRLALPYAHGQHAAVGGSRLLHQAAARARRGAGRRRRRSRRRRPAR